MNEDQDPRKSNCVNVANVSQNTVNSNAVKKIGNNASNETSANSVSSLPTKKILQSVVTVEGAAAVASFDGGAEVSLITKDFVEAAGVEVLSVDISSNDVIGREFCNYGRARIKVCIQQKNFNTECLIVKSLPSDILLGRPWLDKYDATIAHRPGIVTLGKRLKIQCNTIDCGSAQSVAAVAGHVRIPPNSVLPIVFKTATPCKENQVFEIAVESVGGHLALVPGLVIPDGK